MAVDIVNEILQLGGPSAVAIIVIWLQQQNHLAYMKREADNVNAHREDKEKLLQVLENNTSTRTELISTTTQLVTATKELTMVVNRFVSEYPSGVRS